MHDHVHFNSRFVTCTLSGRYLRFIKTMQPDMLNSNGKSKIKILVHFY